MEQSISDDQWHELLLTIGELRGGADLAKARIEVEQALHDYYGLRRDPAKLKDARATWEAIKRSTVKLHVALAGEWSRPSATCSKARGLVCLGPWPRATPTSPARRVRRGHRGSSPASASGASRVGSNQIANKSCCFDLTYPWSTAQREAAQRTANAHRRYSVAAPRSRQAEPAS